MRRRVFPLPLAGVLPAILLASRFARADGAEGPRLVLCRPSASVSKWLELPAAEGPAVALRLAAHPALCLVAGPGSAGLGSCDGAPTFRLVRSRRYPARGYNIAAFNATSGVASTHAQQPHGRTVAVSFPRPL